MIFSTHNPSSTPVRFLDAENKTPVRGIIRVGSFYVRVDVITVLRLSSDHPFLRGSSITFDDEGEYPALPHAGRGTSVLELVALLTLLDNPLFIGRWSHTISSEGGA